jgi:hypothetical protein
VFAADIDYHPVDSPVEFEWRVVVGRHRRAGVGVDEHRPALRAQRFAIDIEEALIRLRHVSEHTDLTLVEVATAVVERDQDSPVTPMLAIE